MLKLRKSLNKISKNYNTVEVIDAAESTPGQSRILFAFRQIANQLITDFKGSVEPDITYILMKQYVYENLTFTFEDLYRDNKHPELYQFIAEYSVQPL